MHEYNFVIDGSEFDQPYSNVRNKEITIIASIATIILAMIIVITLLILCKRLIQKSRTRHYTWSNRLLTTDTGTV